ncbi:MAG: NfeD family protein [Tildeniella nuda ZEHNDER 1965/U140]|jgi:membrane protein implicated in regulation of membrane protease activity|nr:NfeD family protein [Tildeniella nuda ZEHNDER 1965/U140]
MALSPTLIWLLVGAILCLVEFIVPTAFIALVMGVSALIVAAASTIIPPGLQIVLWMVLSLALTVYSRRLVQQKTTRKLDATEAETLTEILPGKIGRVRYEGNSWAARCEDHTLTIAPNQTVYVVARKGTTLSVMPEHLLHSEDV